MWHNILTWLIENTLENLGAYKKREIFATKLGEQEQHVKIRKYLELDILVEYSTVKIFLIVWFRWLSLGTNPMVVYEYK